MCVFVALLGMLILAPGAAGAGVDITTVEGQSFTGNVVNGLTCPLWGLSIISLTSGISCACSGVRAIPKSNGNSVS